VRRWGIRDPGRAERSGELLHEPPEGRGSQDRVGQAGPVPLDHTGDARFEADRIGPVAVLDQGEPLPH
jgi:hypothetical protein